MTESGSAASRPRVRVELPASGPDGVTVEGVALVTLDRREALNALDFALLAELAATLHALDEDPACRCAVITGEGTRAFAAGADIRELGVQSTATLDAGSGFAPWDTFREIGIPLVAAVRGFALGGGCELAMLCDVVIAGDDAVFGQPEIKLGVMPGAGGTQRLPRRIGRARAMDLVLTGRSIDAHAAESMGLVSRVVPAADTLREALAVAAVIAAGPPVAMRAAKRAVAASEELPLTEGLALERRLFFGLFDTEDQKEGMTAYVERRPPRWSGR